MSKIAVDHTAVGSHRRDRLLRIPEVLQRTGLSRATVYRKEAAGTFPRRIPMGENMVGWYESQVDRWVENPLGYRS